MNKKILLLSVICVVFVVTAFNVVPAAEKLYVVNNADTTVYAIDIKTHAVIETIQVGAAPTGIAYNPSTKKAYVVNRGDNTVTVIDTVGNVVTGTVNVSVYPWNVAAVPVEQKIDLNQWIKGLQVYFTYVTSPVNNGIDIIATTFDGLLSIPMGYIKTDVPPGIGAINVALDIANHEAYVVNCHNNILSILDLEAKKEVAKVENLAEAEGFVKMTDGFIGVGIETTLREVYPVSELIEVMPVVDAQSRKVVGKVKVGKRPHNVVVDSSTHKAYVTNRGSNTISVVNTMNDTVEATVKVGVEPISVALADGKAFVTNCGSNNISVIDTKTNTVIDTIPLPGLKPYRGLCPWGIVAF